MIEEFEAHIWEEPPESYGGKIPYIVTDIIVELKRRHAEKLEGLFRLNGSDTQIKLLIDEMDKGKVKDWSKYTDVHTIATALKRYFRTMAANDPIIPFRLYNQIIEVGKLKEDQMVKELKAIYTKLDPTRYHTYSYLMKYLNHISKFSSINKMTAKNLGVCFGPNIIVSDHPDNPQALNDSIVVVNIIENTVKNYDKIFNPDELTVSVKCNKEDEVALSLPPLKWSHVVNLMERNRYRQKYGVFKYVPSANMQMGIVIERPFRKPPPIGEEVEPAQNCPPWFTGYVSGASKSDESSIPSFAIFESFYEEPVPMEEPSVRTLHIDQDAVFVPPSEFKIARAKRKPTRKPSRINHE